MIDVGLVVSAENSRLQQQVLDLIQKTPELQHAFTATSLKVLGAMRGELELGVLLIDADMCEHAELGRHLWDHRTRLGSIPVVVLYSDMDESAIHNLYSVGVKAHINAAQLKAHLIPAIRGVVADEAYLDGEGLRRLLPAIKLDKNKRAVSDALRARFESLSAREQEVFQLLCDGVNVARIAEHLCISEKTVQSHRSSVCRKLEIKTNIELVGTAVALGLVDLGPGSGAP